MARFLALAASLVATAAAPTRPCAAVVTHIRDAAISGPRFGTIAAAQAALRTGQVARSAEGPTTVCLCRGETWHEPLAFAPADGGDSAARPVVYRSVDCGGSSTAAPAAISGAIPVVLTPATPAEVAQVPPRALRDGVLLTANLTAAALAAGQTGIDWATALTWGPRGFKNGCHAMPGELVVGGVPATVAQWPNVNDSTAGTTPGFALTRWGPGGQTNTSFWVNASTAPWLSFPDLTSAWVHGYWYFDWADEVYGVSGIQQTVGGLAEVALDFHGGQPPEGGGFVGGARYFVLNALSALDAVGEYYVNASTTVVYFLAPPGDYSPAGLSALFTVNDTLISVDGARNLAFVDLAFTGSRGGGFQGIGMENVVVMNCTFTGIGTTGVSVGQSNGTLVSGNVVTSPGCGGVRFWEGGERGPGGIVPSGSVAVDNLVTGFERLVFTYQEAVLLDSGGVGAHNEMAYAPHVAASMGGNDALLLGNIIHHTLASTADAAAIYWCPRDWTQQNLTVRWNLLYQNGYLPMTCSPSTSCDRDAIYSDNGNSGTNVIGNVVWHALPPALGCPECAPVSSHVSYGFFSDGGRDNTVTGNIFVLDGSNGRWVRTRGHGGWGWLSLPSLAVQR
jgi:hypothetical protein